MAGYTGSALYLAFNGTVLDTDYRAFNPSEDGDLSDVSAGADANRTYVTNLKDGTASGTILVQADDTTIWGAVAVFAEGTLEWAEEGTAAGKPRHHVNAIVTGRNKTAEYASEVTADISWQFSGAVTDTTY